MKVLHIELGRHLYGGARQVACLLNGLSEYPGEHVLLCVEGASIIGEIANPAVCIQPLAIAGDHDVLCVGGLRRAIKAHRPNLVQIHSRRGDFLGICAARLERLPVIYTRRVDNPPKWVDLRFKFPHVNRIVSISDGIRRVLVDAGVAKHKLAVVRDAVDTDIYRPNAGRLANRGDLSGDADGPTLAVVAQMIPRKGHAVLFHALPKVLARHPNTKLRVFGQGPLEQELRNTVRALNLDRWVSFEGFRSDMADILPGIDLLVHPAFMEGLGVALLEAAACGVPIIASKVGGIPEIVRHGLNGQCVAPGDVDALATAINRLLDAPDLLAEYGKAGRRLVLEQFSIAHMAQQSWSVYQELQGPIGSRQAAQISR